jgi:hypothetical protein
MDREKKEFQEQRNHYRDKFAENYLGKISLDWRVCGY